MRFHGSMKGISEEKMRQAPSEFNVINKNEELKRECRRRWIRNKVYLSRRAKNSARSKYPRSRDKNNKKKKYNRSKRVKEELTQACHPSENSNTRPFNFNQLLEIHSSQLLQPTT